MVKTMSKETLDMFVLDIKGAIERNARYAVTRANRFGTNVGECVACQRIELKTQIEDIVNNYFLPENFYNDED